MKDAFGLSAIYWIVHRELKLTMRRKSDAITPLLFFVIVTSLFPLSVGTDVEMLRRIAPGVLWVTALLATMLSLPRLFEQDYADGTLEQLALSPGTTECNGRWKGSGVLADDRLASGTTCSVVGTSILLADDVHTDISDDAVNRYASVGIDWFDWSQFDAGATWRRRSCRATRTSPLCTGADFWYRGS